MKRRKGSVKKSSAVHGAGQVPAPGGNDADYWQSRATRMTKQSQQYKQPAIREHFAKIAAGYTALAQRARAILDRKS